MLPARANELVAMAMDPHVASNRLASVVAKDPVLATRVLQAANSAFSAPAVEIVSVFEATVRLGCSDTRRIVAAACVSSMVADPKLYGRRGRDLIHHSLGTAYLAWLIAKEAGESPDEAFLYGLLHDVGKFVILKLAKTWRPGIARPEEDEVAAFVAEKHAEFGGHFVRCLRLPVRLQDPIMWHHAPEQAANVRAATVVYTANRLAHRYGFGCAPEPFDPLADPLLATVGVTAESLARLDGHAPALYEMALKAMR
jgi:putative nucleotidyltransferase with HDIG domain